MRNNSIFLSIILLFLFASSALCQGKSPQLSLNVYGGYGFLTPSADNFTATGNPHTATVNNSFDGSVQTNSTTAYTRTKEGLGNGFHTGIGLSLKLNNFISVGIDVDYLTGKKNAIKNLPDDTLTGTFTSNYSVFSIIPNISFKVLTKPKYSIYNTIGIIEAVKTKFDLSYNNTQNLNQTIYTSNNNIVYKYGLNTGFKDAVGIQINVAKHINIFGELAGYFLSVKPGSASRVLNNAVTANGQNASEVINYAITYKNSGSFNYQQTTLNNGNTTVINVSYNDQPPVQHIYSIGLNAGIKFDLN